MRKKNDPYLNCARKRSKKMVSAEVVVLVMVVVVRTEITSGHFRMLAMCQATVLKT